ncbi:MAG TPA: hypothetical protein VL463_22955 [Kofleriaceae bacterium]|jgi:hypothetical protein|nr:hypothetical protein [Kofleriaceae bacterium]
MLAVARRLPLRTRRIGLVLGMCVTAAFATRFVRARLDADAALAAKQLEMIEQLDRLDRTSCGVSDRQRERLQAVDLAELRRELDGRCSLSHGRYVCH